MERHRLGDPMVRVLRSLLHKVDPALTPVGGFGSLISSRKMRCSNRLIPFPALVIPDLASYSGGSQSGPEYLHDWVLTMKL
jgi:hypothetical protein